MARPARFVPRDSSRRRVWVYIGIAAFIAADILLIGFALGSSGTPQAAYTSPPTQQAPVVKVETPAPTAEPVETAAPAVAVLPVPSTHVLTAIDSATAWRAVTGACPDTTATIEVTSDGGATWVASDATGPTQVTAVQRFIVTDATTASAIGLAQSDCSPQLVKTFVAGANYSSYPELLVGSWYVNPANRAIVQTPEGAMTAPCDSVVALAPRDDNSAAVLCANGQVSTTVDSGVTWAQPVDVPGALAISGSDSGYLAAVVGANDCAGIQLLALADGLAPSPVGCFPTSEPAENLSGAVALSQAGEAIWLWAGDALAVSEDAGVNWR